MELRKANVPIIAALWIETSYILQNISTTIITTTTSNWNESLFFGVNMKWALEFRCVVLFVFQFFQWSSLLSIVLLSVCALFTQSIFKRVCAMYVNVICIFGHEYRSPVDRIFEFNVFETSFSTLEYYFVCDRG